MPNDSTAPASPLAILRSIRGEELTLTGLMFTYFFLVITSFWILKPLKKALFIQYYDKAGFDFLGSTFTAAEAELVAKVVNMFVAFVAVVVFTVLSRHLKRERLTFALTGLFVAGYFAYAWLAPDPGAGTVWSFYFFGDLFSTAMVAAFFAFLNDSVDSKHAKRLYGPIGLGGVVGGAFGSMAVGAWIDDLSLRTWLFICVAIAVLIVAVAAAAGRAVARSEISKQGNNDTETVQEETTGERNAALAGAALVLRSRYLLSIVAIVGIYEIVSTIMDFQFTATVAHYRDGAAIGSYLATVYAITNICAAGIQLFGTSWIMTRFGLAPALLVLPVATILGSATFLALPVLLVGSALNTLDNAFNYSINQSAKEALYVPRSREEKYRAKAFIDMFVQRTAKAIAVGVSLGAGAIFSDFSGVRWLSVVSLLLVAVWIVAARYAGRRFTELESAAADAPPS